MLVMLPASISMLTGWCTYWPKTSIMSPGERTSTPSPRSSCGAQQTIPAGQMSHRPGTSATL
jgi:hypothetical protein